MAASIRFNGLPGPLQVVPGAITLSNFNNTGVLGWHWELLDRPIGSAAVIAAPFAASPSFSPDLPGSYRVRLRTYVDAGRTILDASDIQITYILRAAPFAWRQPAAGETTEVDASRGWATAREEESLDTHAYLLGGLQTAFDQVSTIELAGGVLAIMQGGAPVFRFNGAIARAELPDGTEASPGLVFQSEPSTGIYRALASSLSISAAGEEAARFRLPSANNAQVLANIPATATIPSYGFINDETTGISHPTGQAVGILSLGGEALRVTRNGSDQPQILMATGSDPTTRPHYSFAANFDTGMSFADGGLAFYADGTRPLLMTGIAGVPRALFQPGTAGNPSIAFEGDQTTGVFRAGAGIFGIATSGTERVRFQITSSVLATHWYPDVSNTRNLGAPAQRWNLAYAGLFEGDIGRFQTVQVATDGSAAAPSIVWSTFGDNGFYNSGADRVGVTVDGVAVMNWRNVTSTNPKALLASGSLAHPSLAFISDEDTGFFRAAANEMVAVAGGVEAARFVLNGLGNQQVLFPGPAEASFGDVSPPISFVGNTTTGFWSSLANTIAVVSDTSIVATFTKIGVTTTTQFSSGSLTVPSVAVGEIDKGLYDAGAGILGVAHAGTEIIRTSSSGLGIGVNGTDASPALYRTSNPDTGIWFSTNSMRLVVRGSLPASLGRLILNENQMQLTLVGSVRFDIGTAVAAFTVPIRTGDGTAAAPVYSFTSDSDTGIYKSAAGTVGISADATLVAAFSTAGAVFTVDLIPSGGVSIGGPGQEWLNLYVGAVHAVSHIDVADGTAALPAYRFSSDPNTGIYRPGADQIGVSVGGVEEWRFISAVGLVPGTGGLFLGDSEAAPFGPFSESIEGAFIRQTFGNADADPGLPAFSFDGFGTTGIYHTGGEMAFSDEGQETAIFNGIQNASLGTMVGVRFTNQLSNTGSAGFDSFVINTHQPLASGSGVKRLFVLQETGVDRLAVMGDGSGQVQALDGSAASPIYSFINDPDTGIFRAGADQLAFSVGGTQRLIIVNGSVTSIHPFRANNGSVSQPAFSFSGDADTGMYQNGSNVLAFTTASTLRFSIDTLNVTSTLAFLGPNGTVASPTYSFSGDTDNGLYYVTTNQVGMAAGGSQTMRWETTVTASALPFEFASAAMGTPAANTVRLGVPNTAGRPLFLAMQDPYFGETFMATGFHDRQKFFLLPSGATTMVNAGFQFGTSGTVAYVTPTGTSFMTACQKNSFTTAAVISSTADIHSTTPLVAQGNATTQLGFMFHARFALGSNYNSNTRLFVGLINQSTTLAGGTNPGSLSANRLVGVGLNSGSTTLNVYTNDAGGTPQTTSTGITVAANDAFDVWIWMPPNSTTRYVYVNRVNGAAGTFSSSGFAFPPGANQWLYPHSWIATSEAVAKTMYVMRWAIEAGQ